MSSQYSISFKNKIASVLLNSDSLTRPYISKQYFKNYIKSIKFNNNVERIIETNDYSSNAALTLIEDILNLLAQNEAPSDWIYYVYQFVLSKSFPHAVEIELLDNLENPSILYLQVLRVINNFEKEALVSTNQNKYPMVLLSHDEEKSLKRPSEYRLFKKTFINNYVYELMKLHQDITGHNTLEHICGVHYVSMHIARQLLKAGLPVDLGRVSGAAAGHDIGKYGCTKSELNRVPYLHYYYTDLWFKNHNIPYIGHIATNHSTWDLELENLPLESLILIYSDFRVKNRHLKNGGREMYIFSLDESFDIILNKLDNLDEVKEKRYKRVYSKLKDFENYILSLGINVNLKGSYNDNRNNKYYPLIQGDEIVENIKFLSIEHNVNLMYKLRDENSLSSILELARGESDWKNLRAYLQIFQEYSTYLTQKQKLITLNFLYELLIHRDEDIRKQCAELIGILIAMFDEEYRKEVPKDFSIDSPDITSFDLLDRYIKLFLYPDHKIIDAHSKWIGYNFRIMIASLFSNCRPEKKNSYREVLLVYYKNASLADDYTQFYLLQAIKYIPFAIDEDTSIDVLFDFLLKSLNNNTLETRLSSYERIYSIIFRLDRNCKFIDTLRHWLENNVFYSDISAENFLKFKIAKKIQIGSKALDQYQLFLSQDNKKIPDIFLKNLKSATNWITKKIHIELLLEQVIESPRENGLHTAMHFCNLIKVSAIENVRNHAGEALIKIVPLLTLDERNDVTVELLRALEIQGYQFAKYIPNYLGQIMLYLHPVELDELIDDFIEKIKQSSTQVNFLLLRTIGIAIQHYPKYSGLFVEDKDTYMYRKIKMLGILLNGSVSYDIQVKQEAFRVIGSEIFGSRELTLNQKKEIFQKLAKKIMTMLPRKDENELLFLSNSASLNHIYRFISDYNFFEGQISLKHTRKIAFFPGTFDPFSIGHKEIAKEIRNLGFEVYLAVDEFSWSKKTQPHILRRNIISMSIADELDIYLYPEDIQINIANSKDLQVLKESFKSNDVYIVVGSDVILNASGYNESGNPIHKFSHIIFDRRSSLSSENDEIRLTHSINNIDGEIIRLSLPPQYEDVSSTQIRNYIDDNRDISQLIDPLAQKFIYEHGIYRREPQYKSLIQTKTLNVQVYDDIDDNLITELYQCFFKNNEEALKELDHIRNKLTPRIIVIRDMSDKNKILGFSTFHWVRSSMLYNQFKNINISEYIREKAVGRIIVIDGIFTDKSWKKNDLQQILLTETLTFSLAKDYTYAIYQNALDNSISKSLYELLKLHGFQKLPYSDDISPVFSVDMSNPCTLNLDMETIIKEPFRSNNNVIKSLQRSRKKLQLSLSALYPGQLILSFDRDILYETLISKICNTNYMPTEHLSPRDLGPYMCVPFGSILKGFIVPNTVTKSMHTEKMFTPDIKKFTIGQFPYYMTLENQMKMLKSFDRSVILVDDLLNKGYRIKALDPLLKSENISVKKIIVGILSGRGKELMDIQNREVDCAYFIPNLKVWFNENSLYPFIGGDTVWRGYFPTRNLLPSVNFVLPYASPTFIKDVSNDAIYNLSQTCLENAIDLLITLEKEYQAINERSLTLKHLGEVFVSPRCPDHGKSIDYDFNLKPSQYIKNDLEHLKRIEDIIRR